MPDLETSTALTQEQAYPVFFKHKLAARFRVGKHQFTNHIYQVNDAATHENFLEEVKGMLEIDQVQLTQIQNIQNEKPVDLRRVIRGGATTAHANISELESTQERIGELDRREAILNVREADLGRSDELQSKLDAALATIAVLQAGQGTSSAAASTQPVPAPVVEPVDPGLGGEPQASESDSQDKNVNGNTDEPAATPTPKLSGLRLS